MLRSVYQNGGFWVGRYEAGIEINRTSSGIATTTPLSKENLYPYTYVTRTQAKVLADKVESGSYTSSLMFGVQWDLVLKYIETKKLTTVLDIKTRLSSNSIPIGNYYTSEFTLNRGKFAQYGLLTKWYDFNSEDKSSLVTSTKKERTEFRFEWNTVNNRCNRGNKFTKNIYDIAGNVWEWTFEKASNYDSPCTSRGGSAHGSGSNNPASYRNGSITSYDVGIFGFRVSLY